MIVGKMFYNNRSSMYETGEQEFQSCYGTLWIIFVNGFFFELFGDVNFYDMYCLVFLCCFGFFCWGFNIGVGKYWGIIEINRVFY